MIFFSFQNVYVTVIGIIGEILVFISFAIGSFTSDFLWLIKKAIHLLPINIIENIIAKQRHGPIGTIKAHFDPNFTKFSDLTTKDYDNIME